MGRTTSGPSVEEAIHARIDRLSPESIRKWGTMSASGMVCHAADQLRVALGDIEAAPGPLRLRFGSREVKLAPGLLRSRRFRRVLVHGLPWPKARFGAPPEMFTTPPGQWRDDVAALHALVVRVGRKDPVAEWGMHPIFGRISGQEWRLLCWRHLDQPPASVRRLRLLEQGTCGSRRQLVGTRLHRSPRMAATSHESARPAATSAIRRS